MSMVDLEKKIIFQRLGTGASFVWKRDFIPRSTVA